GRPGGAGVAALFPPRRGPRRDGAGEPESAGGRGGLRRPKRLFAHPFPFGPLGEEEVQTLKGVLPREVVVKRRPATPPAVPGAQAPTTGAVMLEVLDAQQEQAARSLGSGHHVLFGVAGSGKTV